MPNREPLMTAQDVADTYRLSTTTVRRMANDGVLVGFRLGRSWRFRPESVRRWAAEREEVVEPIEVDA